MHERMFNLNTCKLFFGQSLNEFEMFATYDLKIKTKNSSISPICVKKNSFSLLSRYEEIIKNVEHVNINPLKIPYCYHEDTDTNFNLRSIPM